VNTRAELRIDGVDDMIAQLRDLADDSRAEAGHLIEEEANATTVVVKTVYAAHVVTGHLVKSVTVEKKSAGRYGAATVIKVNDPIAWLFDNGSQARHQAGTGASTGTMWGRTPPTHVFVRAMIAARTRLNANLADLLRRKGITVHGA